MYALTTAATPRRFDALEDLAAHLTENTEFWYTVATGRQRLRDIDRDLTPETITDFVNDEDGYEEDQAAARQIAGVVTENLGGNWDAGIVFFCGDYFTEDQMPLHIACDDFVRGQGWELEQVEN